jgi:hypothetical protein
VFDRATGSGSLTEAGTRLASIEIGLRISRFAFGACTGPPEASTTQFGVTIGMSAETAAPSLAGSADDRVGATSNSFVDCAVGLDAASKVDDAFGG